MGNLLIYSIESPKWVLSTDAFNDTFVPANKIPQNHKLRVEREKHSFFIKTGYQ